MPDGCSIWVAGIDDSERLDFWNNVYGFDMTPMKEKVKAPSVTDATVSHYEERSIVTETFELKRWSCQTCAIADLEFSAPFRLAASRRCMVDAILAYFDIDFQLKCEMPVSFTTGPQSGYRNHWKQTAFYFPDPLRLDAGDALEGTMHVRRAARNPRHLDITVEYRVQCRDGPRDAPLRYQQYQIV